MIYLSYDVDKSVMIVTPSLYKSSRFVTFIISYPLRVFVTTMLQRYNDNATLIYHILKRLVGYLTDFNLFYFILIYWVFENDLSRTIIAATAWLCVSGSTKVCANLCLRKRLIHLHLEIPGKIIFIASYSTRGTSERSGHVSPLDRSLEKKY